MGDLLLHSAEQVPETGVAQAIDMEEEIVKVQSLGSVGRSRGPPAPPVRRRLRSMAIERLGVVLVRGAVVRAAGRTDQRRIQVLHRIVRRVLVRRIRCGRRSVHLPAKVRVHRPPRVLELSDRPTSDVLNDRLQAPTRAATRWAVRRRLLGHVWERSPRGV